MTLASSFTPSACGGIGAFDNCLGPVLVGSWGFGWLLGLVFFWPVGGVLICPWFSWRGGLSRLLGGGLGVGVSLTEATLWNLFPRIIVEVRGKLGGSPCGERSLKFDGSEIHVG